MAEPKAAPTIVRELEDALSGHHHSILDVSANRIVFELIDGLEALSSGCGLDLHPTRWRPGMCAQTLFGQAQVILHQRDERTTRVFVRPSFERLRDRPVDRDRRQLSSSSNRCCHATVSST